MSHWVQFLLFNRFVQLFSGSGSNWIGKKGHLLPEAPLTDWCLKLKVFEQKTGQKLRQFLPSLCICNLIKRIRLLTRNIHKRWLTLEVIHVRLLLSAHLTHCPSWPNTHVSLDYLLFQFFALILMKDILRYPNERNDP